MKHIKKIMLIFLSLIMFFSLSACQLDNDKDVQKEFDTFIQNEFIKTMESDYTSSHILLINPKDYGVDVKKIKVTLGEYINDEQIQKDKKELVNTLKTLKSFKRSDLTDEQKDTYDIFSFEYKIYNQLNDERFDDYQQLFESMTGIHYQLPTMLADWQLRNEQDVKDLIILVNDVKPYMDAALEYTKKQEEKGLLMVDIDSIIDYCQQIIKSGKRSAVLQSMNTSIDELNLERSQSIYYKKQLEEAFVQSFIPAYQDIINVMKAFPSGKNNTEGYAKFKYGKEYYELLLQKNCGSTKSVLQIQNMMKAAYNNHVARLQEIVSENPDIINQKEPQTKYQNYSQILNDIQKNLFNDFPEVKNIAYQIQDVNEELASSSGVAAYFNIPALDSKEKKQLRVNPKSANISSISTYQTVAHEGFPGHMYQYAYMYENQTTPYRKALANSNAYVEGYAVYSQYYANKYLKDVNQTYLEMLKENEMATYCIIILADIGIHYEGWSFNKFKDFLKVSGLDYGNEKTFKKQYLQLQANPATFEPYYVGCEEFLALKRKAQKKLGNKFKDIDFHKAILKSGNAPFSVIEKNVNEYIQSTK